MKGDYNLVLPGGKTIELRFCTWSLKKYCEERNASFSDLQLSLTEMGYDELIDFILAAAEYKYYKEGKESPYDEFDVSEWIDELGGLTSPVVVEMIGLIVESVAPKKNDLQPLSTGKISPEQQAAEIKQIMEAVEQETERRKEKEQIMQKAEEMNGTI